jgi:hypothetical protein
LHGGRLLGLLAGEGVDDVERGRPSRTMNSVGRMNRIIGTVSIAGSRAAFSSARVIRASRYSAAKTRSDCANGVPNLAVCSNVFTTPRTEARLVRSLRFSKACRRSGKKVSSAAVIPNSSLISGQVGSSSRDTRVSEASRLSPASAQITIKSSASGNPSCSCLPRFVTRFLMNTPGAKNPNIAAANAAAQRKSGGTGSTCAPYESATMALAKTSGMQARANR